jgi:hypothetical protein
MKKRATREDYPPECTHELIYKDLNYGEERVVFAWDSVNDRIWCNDRWKWYECKVKDRSYGLQSLIQKPLLPVSLENE